MSDPYEHEETESPYEQKEAIRTPVRAVTPSSASSRRPSHTVNIQQQQSLQQQQAMNDRIAAASASIATPSGSPTTPATPSTPAPPPASVSGLLHALTNDLPRNGMGHLMQPLQVFFEKYNTISTKYLTLKSRHSSLKSGFKDLLLLKERLEDEVAALQMFPPVDVGREQREKEEARGKEQQAEVERLTEDVVRLKKKCNKVQELAKKAHDENAQLKAQEAARNGSWVGSLLMGGAPIKPPPDPEQVELLHRFSVLREELATKIAENESLHQRMWTQKGEGEEKEKMLTGRLSDLKVEMARMEARLHRAEEEAAQARKDTEQAEQDLEQAIREAEEKLHQQRTEASTASLSHSSLVSRYRLLLSRARSAWVAQGGFDERTQARKEGREWADLEGVALGGSEQAGLTDTTPHQSLAPAFSHPLFSSAHSFLLDTHTHVHRMKSQLQSVVRYWREMKQGEMNAMIQALGGSAAPIQSASSSASSSSSSSAALPPSSFPLQTSSLRSQLAALNALLQQTEEAFECLLGRMDTIRGQVERLIRWDANRRSSSPPNETVDINALVDALSAVLRVAARMMEYQITNLESRLNPPVIPAPSGRSLPAPPPLSSSHRSALVNLTLSWRSTLQLVQEGIKTVRFWPERTGQPGSVALGTGAGGKKSNSEPITQAGNSGVKRHPAYEQSLILPAVWPVIFLLDTLRPSDSPTVASTSSWPSSPLPFFAAFQAHLTELTTHLAVLMGQEPTAAMGTGGQDPQSSSGKSSSLPNFVLANLTTLTKLLGQIPTALVKHAGTVHQRERRAREGALGEVRKGVGEVEGEEFDVARITEIVPQAASTAAPPSTSSSTQNETGSTGGLLSTVHLRSRSVAFLSTLSPSATSPLPPGVPYSLALHTSSTVEAKEKLFAERAREVGRLEEAMKEKERERREMQERVEEVQRQLDDTASSLAETTEKLASTEAALQQTEASLATAQDDLSRAHSDLLSSRASSRSELLSAAEAHRVQLEQLETEQSRLQGELKHAAGREQGLKGEVKAAQVAMEQLQHDLQLERHSSESQSQLLYKQGAKLQSLMGELDTTKSALVQAQAQWKQAQKELQQTKERLKDTEARGKAAEVEWKARVAAAQAAAAVTATVPVVSPVSPSVSSATSAASSMTSEEHQLVQVNILPTSEDDEDLIRVSIDASSSLRSLPQRPSLGAPAVVSPHQHSSASFSPVVSSPFAEPRSSPLSRVILSVESLPSVEIPSASSDDTFEYLPRSSIGTSVSEAIRSITAASELLSASPSPSSSSSVTSLSIDDTRPQLPLSVAHSSRASFSTPSARHPVTIDFFSSPPLPELPRDADADAQGGEQVEVGIGEIVLPLTERSGSTVHLSAEAFHVAAAAPGASPSSYGHRSSLSQPLHAPVRAKSPATPAGELLERMHSCADQLLSITVSSSPGSRTPAGELSSASSVMGKGRDVACQVGREEEVGRAQPGDLLKSLESATAASASPELGPSSDGIVSSSTPSTSHSSSCTSAAPLYSFHVSSSSSAAAAPSQQLLRPSSSTARASDEIDPSDLYDDDEEAEDGEGTLTGVSTGSPRQGRSRGVSLARAGVQSSSSEALTNAAESLWPSAAPKEPLSASEGASILLQHSLLARLDSHSTALSSLQTALSAADAKASLYFMQVQQLALLLQSTRAAYESAAASSNHSASLVLQLQEELRATKENYEGMNIELTEKVCQLTEELASQDAKKQTRGGIGGMFGR